MHFQNFQKMIHLAERDLGRLQEKNLTALEDLFNRTQSKYVKALNTSPDSPSFRDKTIYKPQDIKEYGQDFLSYVDPHFVQDIVKNQEWYKHNLNKFLLNLNYPCKLQTDFLKELELAQQRRNDMKYRKILDQMDKVESMIDKLGDDAAKRKELEDSIKKENQMQRALIA